MARVLVVDDEKNYVLALDALLAGAGHEVVGTTNPLEVEGLVDEDAFDCVITDLKMPRMDGLDVLRAVQRIDPGLPVIVLTAHGTVETAVEALRAGAHHYLLKPFNNEEIVLAVAKAAEYAALRRERNLLLEQVRTLGREGEFIGRSAAMEEVFRLVGQVAPGKTTVLITGESGTGKELVARAIHRGSPRADGPFVAVNCTALSENLLESELFGHERGAFTGAHQRRRGRFELADGGTLLLDEIGETSPPLQAKLLRVLQEGEFERVGSERPVRVDVRVLAATNRDLAEMVREGTFREDLYYRLNVVPVHLPPLRERRDDIGLLALHFLRRYAAELKKEVVDFTPDAMRLLAGYRWPGNVRELENVIERAVVLSRAPEIVPEVLPPELGREPGASADEILSAIPPDFDLQQTLEDVEKRLLIQALRENDFVQARAAAALGLTRSHMQYKLKKHGLHAGSMKDEEGDA